MSTSEASLTKLKIATKHGHSLLSNQGMSHITDSSVVLTDHSRNLKISSGRSNPKRTNAQCLVTLQTLKLWALQQLSKKKMRSRSCLYKPSITQQSKKSAHALVRTPQWVGIQSRLSPSPKTSPSWTNSLVRASLTLSSTSWSRQSLWSWLLPFLSASYATSRALRHPRSSAPSTLTSTSTCRWRQNCAWPMWQTRPSMFRKTAYRQNKILWICNQLRKKVISRISRTFRTQAAQSPSSSASREGRVHHPAKLTSATGTPRKMTQLRSSNSRIVESHHTSNQTAASCLE